MPADDMPNVPPEPSSRAVVGRPHPQDSARLQILGAAAYIDDVREPAGTLHVACGLSSTARGRIERIDLSAVRDALEQFPLDLGRYP